MIDFLYKLDYEDGFQSKGSHTLITTGFGPLVFPSRIEEEHQEPTSQDLRDELSLETSASIVNAQVYAVADKFEVPGLKALSQQKFRDSIASDWNLPVFPRVVRLVYESTPAQDQGLRSVIASVSQCHFSVLKHREEFAEVLREVHDFALDILYLSENRVGWS